MRLLGIISKDTFGDRIIRRRSSFPWPEHSPDLNPLAYWFWGHASSIVPKKSPNCLGNLMRAVYCIYADIDSRQIKRIIENLNSKLLACITSKRDLFQQKLNKHMVIRNVPCISLCIQKFNTLATILCNYRSSMFRKGFISPCRC